MADLGTGQNLFQDWYDTYVLPKKNMQIEGVFRRGDKPDWSLGLPKSPTPAPTAPVATPAAIPAPEAAPEVPLTDYTTQPPATPEATDPSWLDKISTGMRESKGMSPGAMGLLGMGLSMAATPPRAVPYSTAEIIGQSGLHGLAFYEKALEDKRKQQALDVSAEEHKLTREDRRLSAIDRAEYYKDRARIADAEQQSRDEARKATAEERAVLDVPIDPAVAAHYGVDPKMTVRTFNKMQTGLTAMAKPEKEVKPPDRYQNWRETFKAEHGRYPNAKEEERFGKTEASGAADGPGKPGATAQVNSLVTSHYFADAKKNLESQGPAGREALKGMTSLFATADPLGGGVHAARVRQALSPEKQREFDFVTETAQEYSKTMVPAKAVAKAKKDWAEQNPAPKAPSMNQRYNEFKSVYEEIRASSLTTEQKTAKLKELSDYARSQGLIQ